MKILLSIVAWVGAQDTPFPPPTPPQTPATPTTTTTMLPTVSEADRCNKNNGKKVNFYNSDGPKPSSGAACPSYECGSCCNDEKLNTFFQPLKTPEGNLKQHGLYNFAGCSGTNKNTEKTGHVSAKCQEYLTQNFCLSSCSPNVYMYKTSGAADRRHDMGVCGGYCNDFYNACKDDHVCYNEAGLKEYIFDAMADQIDSNKKYSVFACEGAYECVKLSESRVAKPMGKANLVTLLKGKCNGNANLAELDICKKVLGGEDITEAKPAELFCTRFSFGLFKQSNEDYCIDPRNEQTVIHQVQMLESGLNQNGDKVKFVTTPVCTTGLSGGAIAGIVIGVLAGIGLIAGLVWYFACRSKGGEEDYAQGKQSDMETAGSHGMSQKEPTRDESIVRSEADYDPSRHASQK